MENFRDALKYCNLANLGHKGDSFTWINRHSDLTFTKERLDRAVPNSKLIKLFWDFWVESLVARSLDHRLILVTCKDAETRSQRRKKLFRYEVSWNVEEECSKKVTDVWRIPITYHCLVVKVQNLLKQCELDLKKWSVNKGCNYASDITLKSARLK